jgi:hypothetical protein
MKEKKEIQLDKNRKKKKSKIKKILRFISDKIIHR